MAPAPLTKTLEFEKKNQKMPKLPKHVKIQKRPIPHPSTPSPYSGSSSPKTIYVSSSSPTMGVVKRVQKYLRAAENRATAKLLSGNNKGKKGDRKNQIAQLAQSNEALKKEEVFVKATGRAMERALKVGKWFEARGEEYTVSVKTGSVLVVDDVVEDEEERKKAVEESERLKKEVEEAKLKDGNGDLSKSALRKRKRAVARLEGEEELPETRTRWVNMVEVAVSLNRQAQSGFSRFPAPRIAAMDLDLVPIVRFPGVTTTAGRLPWKILPVTQPWSAIDLIEVWEFFTYNGTATPLAI
ncbi:hypothetical protein BO79DRAFT_235693 [Aspergillus costaricaensis CBS 115574]|uniref:Uncharacterized protein n=1 Tax=Aspergillus costaricaensis CBS 115574 TaxID=1448317 RepID=A0ACD1IRQ4_9EURO|nr:hypothetical protein BO79DRAFT_235693 [Aspergillus costaricaensis CBS 115574]RAK92440.1 hypothetical protein BO79DRAFT_235693 [Aspergillus costaricaensis CBS 115574]